MKKQVIRGLINGHYWSKYEEFNERYSGILYAKRFNINSADLNNTLLKACKEEPCEIVTIFENK